MDLQMTIEIVTYLGWGKDRKFQFGGASLFIDGIEKNRIVQRSTSTTHYALVYLCIDEIVKNYDEKIKTVVIVQPTDLGINGKGRMKNYAYNLRNNTLKNAKIQIENDALRCQKIRDQIVKPLTDLENDVFYSLPIDKQVSRQPYAQKAAVQNETSKKMSSIFQKKLHATATTWKTSDIQDKANNQEASSQTTTAPAEYEIDKLKYAYFSDLNKRFDKQIKAESQIMQNYCIEVIGYLAMGCVLKSKKKFKKMDRPIGAMEFRLIADNLNYSQLKNVAESIKNNNPNNPAFYSLAIFAQYLDCYDVNSQTTSIDNESKVKTTKAIEKFEAYQPKKKSRQSNTDYSAFGSRYIKVDDRRGQVILAQFDRLPEEIKQDIYKHFKEKADIDLFLANNWTD